MLNLTDQLIVKTGWAGPLLWLVTNSGGSIHLHDSKISLNDKLISPADDLSSQLCGAKISDLTITQKKLRIEFSEGTIISVTAAAHETARIFRKGNKHYIYQKGELSQEL